MNVANQVGLGDRVPESKSSAFEPAPAPVLPLDAAGFDAAREINARRAQVENPELLRRLRSL